MMIMELKLCTIVRNQKARKCVIEEVQDSYFVVYGWIDLLEKLWRTLREQKKLNHALIVLIYGCYSFLNPMLLESWIFLSQYHHIFWPKKNIYVGDWQSLLFAIITMRPPQFVKNLDKTHLGCCISEITPVLGVMTV